MATFGGASGKSRRRRTDSPSAHLARIVWILLTLLYDGVLDVANCLDRFGVSRREFQRDLLKIREIGKGQGFSVSSTSGGRVFLHASDARAGRLSLKGADALDTLSRIAAALGGPIEREMRKAIGERPADQRRGFLQVREVIPSDSDRVGGVFTFLKEAATTCARVEFSYTPARGARAARRVEPYHVVARSGRYYLIAYDIGRRDWRYFALDAISGPMRKDGTFSPRPVPEKYLAERAVGWLSGAVSVETTFWVSPVLVATVKARKWQPGQRLVRLADGVAEITLSFDDLGEAVRWALSFGPEAMVIGPPEAVTFARQMVERIASTYADQSVAERKELTA